MSIFLIGYRGSGKTTLGRLLADRLSLPFRDCDEWIVRRDGRTIREIFEQSGESAFRDLEQTILSELVALPDGVIVLGGGTLERPANQAALRSRPGHRIIYIRAEPEELLRRVQSDAKSHAHRPNLTSLGGGIEEIRTMLVRREPVYRQMKTDELDVTRLSIHEALAELLQLLHPASKP